MPSRAASKAPSQPNQSVIDALTCLEAVVSSPEPVAGRELARLLGIDRVRVNRLLMTLAHCGVLEKSESRRYRPGPGIHVLAALASEGSSLARRAIPHIRPWIRGGYSVTLGVLWRQYVCYLIRAKPGMPLEESLGDRRGPALESSAGLMLLSSLPDKQLARLDVKPFAGLRPATLGTDQLIARTRKNRFALLEFSDGSISIGCAISDPPIAAIAVSRSGLSRGEMIKLIPDLRITAGAISQRAG